MDKTGRIGEYIKSSAAAGEHYLAYVPQPLPPVPPLDMLDLAELLDKASAALGRLDGMSMVLPDPSLFIYMYIRKEAVLSSQVEGTQSSLSDLLFFENEDAPGVPFDDVAEVSSYVTAMNYGLERLKDFPLSLRLIREIHGQLMNNARGRNKNPGEFRSSQNWIGGARPGNARFVPPPPEKLKEALYSFEKFLHDENTKLPALIKAALAHVQFETLHPFLDGNGRLGRLLITFILCVEGALTKPLLYLSLYLKANRQAYYDYLQSVRETGDWEAWIKFFLQGVVETSNQATETAISILDLFKKDRSLIEESGRGTALMIVYNHFQHYPLSNTTRLRAETKKPLPTILRSLASLEQLGIIKEISGKERHKVFVYREYLDILGRDTEPLISDIN